MKQKFIMKLVTVFILLFIAFYAHPQVKIMKDTSVVSTSKIAIRYIVKNVEEAVTFYTGLLRFEVVAHPGPGFAQLSFGNLHLLLNKPGTGGAGKAMQDGTMPQPGGWNRFQYPVKDIETFIVSLKQKGAHFRNELVVGNGGKQILLQDPSGNLVELFESNY